MVLFRSSKSAFSRHDNVRASSTLFIWLNENVVLITKHCQYGAPYKLTNYIMINFCSLQIQSFYNIQKKLHRLISFNTKQIYTPFMPICKTKQRPLR